MRTFILWIGCMLAAFILRAQSTGKASVTVSGRDNAPVEDASVELLRARDSVLVKSALTDRSGSAQFDHLALDTFLVRVSAVGLGTAYSGPFQLTDLLPSVQLPGIRLSPKETSALQTVTVSARKPFIQKLSDRIVVNVDNSIVGAGSSAMDVLERSPGVTVDQNDVISLRGKAGVIIMIDGKPSPMTGQDLANYLRGLPANAIERIDLITNPSAKYDAAGSSGIIDIRMKKDQRLGTNGSFTIAYGQGIYPKTNEGATFNYRNKKVNVFGNYNYAYRENLNHLVLNRNFFDNGVFKGGDNKDNYAHMPVSSHTARVGTDFFVSQNTIIGFVVNGNFNHFRRDNKNNSVVMDEQQQPLYTFKTQANNNDHFSNAFANLNLKHSFGKTGRELTTDFDYGTFNKRSSSTTATRYYTTGGAPYQPDYILDGDQDGKLRVRTAKADYVHPMKKGIRLEAGLKASHVSSDNDARFWDRSSGTPVEDESKTNHFLYEENNTAGYLNAIRDYKRLSVQIGLRGEQTGVKTHQLRGDIRWDSSYFQLFPSMFVNYKLKEDQSFGVSVSRRINRPGYADLNPFLFLIDVSTYATGSPGLLPELTWSYELSYTVKQLSFTLAYSHTKDNENIAIARFKDVFPSVPSADNVTVQIPINLSSSDYIGLTAAAPVHVVKWWNMVNNLNVYYNHFNGNLGGSALNNGAPAADLRTDNSFTFKKGWSAELNASFSSGGRYGYMVSRPQWALSSGIQRQVFRSRGTFRFNVTDIFWTNLPRATITYEGKYIENWHAYRESRVANLIFTYRFGSSKVQAARRRTTASEEERRRAGAN